MTLSPLLQVLNISHDKLIRGGNEIIEKLVRNVEVARLQYQHQSNDPLPVGQADNGYSRVIGLLKIGMGVTSLFYPTKRIWKQLASSSQAENCLDRLGTAAHVLDQFPKNCSPVLRQVEEKVADLEVSMTTAYEKARQFNERAAIIKDKLDEKVKVLEEEQRAILEKNLAEGVTALQEFKKSQEWLNQSRVQLQTAEMMEAATNAELQSLEQLLEKEGQEQERLLNKIIP